MEDGVAAIGDLIARGDRRRAAALLVQQYAPAVFSLCRAMVRDRQLAEDLSQDAFARAFAALDGYRGEASPRTWLLKIARNRCLDHLDRARRAPWGRDPDPDPDEHVKDEPPPIDLLARREDAERAMAVLAETERALVVLHFGHGVGYPELADSFGIGQGAVRMRVSRALARMRDALREQPTVDAEVDELAITGRHTVHRRAHPSTDRAVPEANAGLQLDRDDHDFGEEEASASLSSEFLDEGPTSVRDQPRIVIVPALRDELSRALLARLDSLATAL